MSRSKEKATKKGGFERKVVDGKPNSKYVDLLEEDKAIAGQKFVCVSFVSPEKVLKQKEVFFFEQFLKKWDLVLTNMTDEYKTYLDNNEEELEKSFGVASNFQTCTRGLKIRGSYPTIEEAELRCKMLRELDPNHDVFVGPVGLWMPWDPEAYKTGRVEYMEEELNQLMHEKTKNEANAKHAFEQRVKESKQKAIEENIKNAEKTGNMLTQSIDEQGNLVGVNNINTQEGTIKEKDTISAADIRMELFEGENIVVGKTDNGQSELISGPFATKK